MLVTCHNDDPDYKTYCSVVCLHAAPAAICKGFLLVSPALVNLGMTDCLEMSGNLTLLSGEYQRFVGGKSCWGKLFIVELYVWCNTSF